MKRKLGIGLLAFLIIVIISLLVYAIVPSLAKKIYQNTLTEQKSICNCDNQLYISTAGSPNDSGDSNNFTATTGQIGDTIGGTIGPFIAIIAAALTFLAFYIQYEANLKQTQQFKNQDIDTKRERVETKFYEMIKLHRENVLELDIKNKFHGRKVFLYLYSELKFGYYNIKKIITELTIEEKNRYKIPLNNYELEAFLCNISYMVFYIGVGPNSDKMLKDVLNNRVNEELLNLIIAEFKIIQKNYFKMKKTPEKSINSTDQFHVKSTINVIEFENKKYKLYPNYKPFNGHLIRLGHYYRHLIQTVKLIAEQDNEIITDKYFYLKNLRAQLSGHEQVMLYYNALSDYGVEWFNHPYFTDYAMIRNIPLSLADFGIKPDEHPKIKPELEKDPSILEAIELKIIQQNK